MKSREAFEFWMKSDYFDEDTKKELEKSAMTRLR